MGTEGAKVLRELGNKVKNTMKLSPFEDILSEVHEAAEELQKKIDRRSYLLVNSECWEIGRRPVDMADALATLNTMEEDATHLPIKSRSEAILDLRYVQVPKSWDVHDSNTGFRSSYIAEGSPSNMIQKQITWPVRRSFNADAVTPNEGESRTYESASALSLATFSSLLIEFVARLQNLVDSFVELSEVARFREPVGELAVGGLPLD